jgi:hypothetical protein
LEENPTVLMKDSMKNKKNPSVFDFSTLFEKYTASFGKILKSRKIVHTSLSPRRKELANFRTKKVQTFPLKTWDPAWCIVQNYTNQPCKPIPRSGGTTVAMVSQGKACLLWFKSASEKI